MPAYIMLKPITGATYVCGVNKRPAYLVDQYFLIEQSNTIAGFMWSTAIIAY